MRRICLVFILALLSGFVINCGQAPPAQNTFRLKTRVKFRLFGFIPLFSIPAPFQQINLKTNTMPGAPGTTGTTSEFNINGAYVTTDHVGKYDPLSPVIPATWTVKVNPNQPLRYPCMYPATMSFQAQGGQTYKYKCSIDIVNSFASIPSDIYVNDYGIPNTGNNPINWGVKINNTQGDAVFSSAENLSVEYYRLTQIDTTNGDYDEIYQLESTTAPSSISPDGTEITIPYPQNWRTRGSGFLLNGTAKLYHIVLKEDDVYVGHTPFIVDYPEQNCDGRTRVC